MAYNDGPWGRKYPASRLHVVQEQGRDVIYGRWSIGAMYGNDSSYYGAYPRTYLERLMTLFPDARRVTKARQVPHILHAFSGALAESRDYWRLDVNPKNEPELVGSVYDVVNLAAERAGGRWAFDLVCADPPYSDADALIYGTEMIDRRRVCVALADVMTPGALLCWLDTTWPMHSKRDLVTVGRICVDEEPTETTAPDPTPDLFEHVGKIRIVRSTNHRLRDLTIFERVAA